MTVAVVHRGWRTWRPRGAVSVNVVVGGALVLFLGLPLWQLVYGSLHAGDPFQPGGWTLDNYRQLASNESLLGLARTSLWFAGSTTLACLVVGVGMAWVVERTNVPGARTSRLVAVVPLLIPALVGTTAWSVLLSKRTGLLNVFVLEPVLGWRFDVFSFAGMVWVQSTMLTPLVFLFMSAAFRRADPDIEHAARLSGSGRLRAMGTSLGVVRPAILTSALVVFIFGLESIEIPLIFGFPARVSVFSGEIYRALRVETPTRWGGASALSVILIGVVLMLFVLYLATTRHRHRYVTVGGRSAADSRIDLGWHRWLAFVGCALMGAVTLVIPLLAVAYGSIVAYVGRPSRALLATASLDNYRALLDNEVLRRAVRNSFTLSLGAGVVAVLVATLIVVMAVRHRSPLAQANEAAALLPLSIPRIALAPAFLWSYLFLPFGLGRAMYGTLTMMGIAYVVMFLPIGTRQISAQLMQVSPDLEAAGRVSGGGPMITSARILMPIMAPALSAAFFLAFISFFREFSVSALMYGRGTEVFSVAMFAMLGNGETGQVAALSVVFVVVITAMLGIGVLVTGRVARRGWIRARGG